MSLRDSSFVKESLYVLSVICMIVFMVVAVSDHIKLRKIEREFAYQQKGFEMTRQIVVWESLRNQSMEEKIVKLREEIAVVRRVVLKKIGE